MIYRSKKKQRSQTTNTELHHDVADQEKGLGTGENDKNIVGVGDGEADIHELQGADTHQLHGKDIAPYSRELEGSPGVKRHELPTRRGTRRGSV